MMSLQQLVTILFGLVQAHSKLLRHSTSSLVDYWVKLDNFNNVQYSASFSVGGQVLPVIYDTGSFEIIVLSTLCRSCAKGHIMYDRLKSTSFGSSAGMTAEHFFGSGNVVSQKGFETIRLGSNDSPYAVGHFPFWQVMSHQIEVWNRNAHFSGIIGLGHPDYIPEGYGAESSDGQTMLAALSVRRFALCLERNRIDAPGWLSLGPSLDRYVASGLFSAVPVVGKVHWGVKLTNLQVPGVFASNPCVPSCGAIVDSGTSLLAVPPSALRLANALSNMIRKDCSNLHSLPVLRMTLGSTEIELPPKVYVMQVRTKVSKNSTIWRRMIRGPEDEDVMRCSAGFMTMDKMSQYGPVWILGMPFLRYYHTIFDRGTKQLHIRPSTPACQVPAPTTAMTAPASSSSLHPHFVNSNATDIKVREHRQQLQTRLLVADDFAPMEVDLNDARAPMWSEKSKGNFIF